MSLNKLKTKKKITSQVKNINNTIEEKIKQYLNDKNQEYNNQRFIKFSNKSFKKIREYCNFNHNTKDNEIKDAVYKIYLFAVFNPEWFENHDKIRGGLLNFVIEIDDTIQTTDFEELPDGPYKNNKIYWLKENIDEYNDYALDFKKKFDINVDKIYIDEINNDLQNINSNKLSYLINPVNKIYTIGKSNSISKNTLNNLIKNKKYYVRPKMIFLKVNSITISLKSKRCPWGYRYNKSLKLCRLCNINTAKKRISKTKKL